MARKIIREQAQTSPTQPRALELRVARISDVAGWDDLTDKVVRLWHIDAPEVAARLQRLGAAPLQDPSLVGGELYQHGSMRAVLFQVPDSQIWVLYALGSAASSDDQLDGDNAFVRLIASLLGQLRPQRLVVPELDRLVRSLEHVSQLWRAVKAQVNEIRSSDERIGLHEAYAEMRFMLAALAASTEARMIGLRTFYGKMQNTVDGKTILTPAQIPPGYRKLDDKRVAPAPGDHHVVSTILQGMAAGLSDEKIVAQAAAAGATSLALQRLHGPTVTLRDHSNPAQLARSWYACLELWEHGIWHQALQCPDATREDYDGHLVHLDDKGQGNVVIPMQWGLPEGGWADEETFAKARNTWEQRQARARATGGATHQRRRPLSGVIDFTSPEGAELAHYRLFSDQVGVYQLRRRVLTSEDQRHRGWGRRPNLDGTEVAKVRCSTLHRYLADQVVDTIARGAVVEFLDGLSVWREGNTIRVANRTADSRTKLHGQLERAHRRCDNLERSLADAANEDVRQRVNTQLHEAVAEVSSLEQQLADLDADVDEAPALPEQFTSEIGFLTSCLATLRETTNTADREFGEALKTIFQDCRLRPHGTDLELSTYVLVPANGAVARIPITGSLPADGRQARATGANSAKMLEVALGDGLPVEQVAALFGKRSHEAVRRALMDELKRYGLARRAREFILRYAPPSLRRVVWASLTKSRVPDGIDPDYAKLATDTYRGSSPIGSAKSVTLIQPKLQRICDYLAHYGGTAPIDGLRVHLEQDGISPPIINTALTHRVYYNAHQGKLSPRTIQRCPSSPQTHVRLIDCPHCGGFARIALRLPEVPHGLLCPDCRRMPTPDSPTYPADYITTGTTLQQER